MYGELIPQGGGDLIPLTKERLMVGRRESCDIVLRYPNVSSQHCQLSMEGGYWYAEDLNSSNGTRINNVRIMSRQRLDPGDMITFAKFRFQIQYKPDELGAVGPPPVESDDEFMDIMNKSLLDRAGLQRKKSGPEQTRRYDPTSDDPGQLKNRPKYDD